METMYLLQCFDRSLFQLSIPDPGLFRTEEEARQFCEQNSNSNLEFSYRSVRVGKMEIGDWGYYVLQG